MRAFFTSYGSHALLLRGAEGEAVAHPRREPVLEWLDGKTAEVWRGTTEENPELPGGRDAAATAQWIAEVMSENRKLPAAISHQIKCCTRATIT